MTSDNGGRQPTWPELRDKQAAMLEGMHRKERSYRWAVVIACGGFMAIVNAFLLRGVDVKVVGWIIAVAVGCLVALTHYAGTLRGEYIALASLHRHMLEREKETFQ